MPGDECFEDSSLYKGRRICTTTARPCQRWDTQTPNVHNYTDDAMFPDDNVTEAKDYCRDPGGVKGQPWCYTTDPNLPWEYCGIPECSGRVPHVLWSLFSVRIQSSMKRGYHCITPSINNDIPLSTLINHWLFDLMFFTAPSTLNMC